MLAERIEMKVGDGSPSVSEVYMMRDTAVSGAFLQRRKTPHILVVMVASHALADLEPPSSTFGPLLVLSMDQTRT